MPNKPHHTAKFKSCVANVTDKGHDESSAYAICTTSLQKAGEPIFEAAESCSLKEYKLTELLGMRTCQVRPPSELASASREGKWSLYSKTGDKKLGEFATEQEVLAAEAALQPHLPGHLETLHVLAWFGQTRTVVENKIEYLVVPIVALMEGVIHPVNAKSAEFVPFNVLEQGAASWNGKPIVIGHPSKNGKQCSACQPDIISERGIGEIRNSHADSTSKKMLQEGWIIKSKAKKLHPDMMAALERGEPIGVSVGAFVETDPIAGEFNSRSFKVAWYKATGDHLALLPGGRGACSLDMGCGTHRAATSHLVTAEGIEMQPPTYEERVVEVVTALEESLTDRMNALDRAVQVKYPTSNTVMPASPDYAYVQQAFDDRVIVRKGEELYSIPYAVDKDGKITLGDATKVKQVYIAAAAKTKECAACKGSGSLDGNPCEMCDGNGEVKVMAGARHSAEDSKMIQGVHDHAVGLGAKCDRNNYTALGTSGGTPQKGKQPSCGCQH